MKKKIVALALLLSMAVSLAGCGTKKSTADPSTGTQDTITLTMAMTDSEQTNYYKGAMKIVDAVKEATNGRIVIDVKPGGTLGNETDELDMVIQGGSGYCSLLKLGYFQLYTGAFHSGSGIFMG